MPVCDTPSASSVNHEQFEATRKVQRIIYVNFHAGMPLTTHRRQLRTYAETFTGKDALDFADQIFPPIFPLCSNREKSRQLLERFLCWGYITNVREESCRNFYDNATLYRLKYVNRTEDLIEIHNAEDEMNRRRSTLLTRSSSVRDRNLTDRMERLQIEKSLPRKVIHHPRKDLSQMAKLSGRLSISCQNISTLEKQCQEDSSQTKKSGAGVLKNLVNIGRASANLFSLHRSNSDSARGVRQRKFGSPSATADSKLCCDSHIAMNKTKKRDLSHSIFKTTSTTTAHLLPQQVPRYRAPMLSRSHIIDQNRV